MTLVRKNPASLGFLLDDLFTPFNFNLNRETTDTNTIPPVNIHESDTAFHLDIVAPGREKEDFKLKVENNLLTVSFEYKENKEVKENKTIRREFSLNSFARTFTLDDKIDHDNIVAKYENGILKITLAKKEETKSSPKHIAIN